MQEVLLGDPTLVTAVKVATQVEDLSVDQLREHLLQQAPELVDCQFLMSAVSLRVLVEEELGVELALDKNLLYLADHFLSV